MNPYIAQMTSTFIDILTWAIIARALLSWFPIDQGSAVYQMLWRVTEPIIDPFRRILPQTGMIDLSPLAAIFALIILSLMFNSLAVVGQ